MWDAWVSVCTLMRHTLNAQVVLARFGRGVAKGSGEELDVLGLMRTNLDEATSNPVGEPGVGERLRVELAESLGVEGVLEVLKSQGELENARVKEERPMNTESQQGARNVHTGGCRGGGGGENDGSGREGNEDGFGEHLVEGLDWGG